MSHADTKKSVLASFSFKYFTVIHALISPIQRDIFSCVIHIIRIALIEWFIKLTVIGIDMIPDSTLTDNVTNGSCVCREQEGSQYQPLRHTKVNANMIWKVTIYAYSCCPAFQIWLQPITNRSCRCWNGDEGEDNSTKWSTVSNAALRSNSTTKTTIFRVNSIHDVISYFNQGTFSTVFWTIGRTAKDLTSHYHP